MILRKELNADTVQNFEYTSEYQLLRNYETVGDSLCGRYMEFHSNEKLKLKGRYVLLPSEELVTVAFEDLLTGEITYEEIPKGMVSHKTGTWSLYDEKGLLIQNTNYSKNE